MNLSDFGQVRRRHEISHFDEEFQSSVLAAYPHERRGGGSLSTRMVRLDSPAHEVTDPATNDLVIGLMLKSSGAAAWRWDSAKWNTTMHRRPGTLGVSPLGATGRFEIDGPSSILIVALPFARLAERLEPDFPLRRDLGELHDAYASRPIARRLCLKLWAHGGSPGRVSDIRIDWLSEQLTVHLAGNVGEVRDHRNGGLGVSEKARVLDIAESGDVDVSDLARSVAIPVRTFRRRFQVSFGMSPHDWLVARRIDLAKKMLTDKNIKLSDLALAVGFSSQAHLTETFRRSVGISPGRYRRDIFL